MKLLLFSVFIIVQSDVLNQQNSPPDQTDAPHNLSQTVSQHVKLSRILNAINLQLKLTNKKIDNIDVIAGIWDVDKKAINSLASLRTDALAESMSSLEKMVNEFPDDLHRIGDVEEISKRLDAVKVITPEKRRALRLAMRNDSVPRFLEREFIKWDFLENVVNNALKEVDLAKELPVAGIKKEQINPLIRSMDDIVTVLREFEALLIDRDEWKVKTIDELLEGYKAAIEVKNKARDLKELSKLLADLGTNLPSVQPLRIVKGAFGTQEQSRDFLNAFLQLHQPSKTSLAPAFTSDHEVAKFKDGLKDKWIANLLAGEQNLDPLEFYLAHIATIARKITPINQNMKTLMNYDLVDQVDMMSRSIDLVSKLQHISNQFNLASLSICNESPDLTDQIDPGDLEKLSKDFTKFFEVVFILANHSKEIKPIRESLLSNLIPITDIDTENFEKWLNDVRSSDSKFLKTLNEAKTFFDLIVQTQDVADSIARVSAGKENIVSVHKKLKEFTIQRKECEALFSFDIESLRAFNDIPDTIRRMKEEKTIEKIKPLMNIIPAFTDDIIELTPSVYEMPKPNPNAKIFKTLNYQDLLDVGICATALENMELIQRYDKYFDNLIYSGVIESIQRVKNKKNKVELEKIWGNFSDLKAKLEGIRLNNRKLLEAVTLSGKEKTLGDIFYVYRNLTSLNPSERVFLNDLRLSMRLFEQPDKRLMESLEKLEKPLATDWQMAHAKMKRLPDILWAINRSFEIFFWKRKDKEMGILEQMGSGIVLLIMPIFFFGAIIFLIWFYFREKRKMREEMEKMEERENRKRRCE